MKQDYKKAIFVAMIRHILLRKEALKYNIFDKLLCIHEIFTKILSRPFLRKSSRIFYSKAWKKLCHCAIPSRLHVTFSWHSLLFNPGENSSKSDKKEKDAYTCGDTLWGSGTPHPRRNCLSLYKSGPCRMFDPELLVQWKCANIFFPETTMVNAWYN